MVPDEWKYTFNLEGKENLEKVSDKGGNTTQYVQMNWEVKGETIDLGTRVYQTNNNEINVGVAVHGGNYQGSPGWWQNASGKVDEVYPEAIVVGFAQAGLKSLTKQVINFADVAAGSQTANVVSAGENALVSTFQYDIPGHGAERLVQRGISEKMAQTAISKGSKYFDPKNGAINYILEGGFSTGKDLLIGTNPITGAIKTGIRGTNLVRLRMIPIQ